MATGKYADGNEKIYFTAGINTEDSFPNLSWVARNFPRHTVCLLHVLQPSSLVPYSKLMKGADLKTVQKILEKYNLVLKKIGSKGEDVYIKTEKIEEGIVKLISQHGIKNLVMGAEAKEMVYIESKKTKYVSENGSASCQIWFLHKGHLIKTRYEQVITGGGSVKELYKKPLTLEKPVQESPKAASKPPNTENLQSGMEQPVKEAETEILDSATRRSVGLDDYIYPQVSSFSLSPVDDELHEHLKQATAEANKASNEAFEESLRRQKAEKAAVEAVRRAKAAEKICTEEMQIRKECEDAILKQRQKLENMRSKLVPLMEELKITLGHKSSLEGEMAELKKKIDEQIEKIISSVQLLLCCKSELDELKITCDAAVQTAEALRQKAERAKSSSSLPKFLSEFSYSEIGNATCFFHPSLIIEECGSWSVYKGILLRTEVAIKLLRGDSLKGPSVYKLEVDVLRRLRHRNIVTLIGVCPEASAIIYEHAPNGSLEDRLLCKDNSFPLPWQIRTRIAFELCSVLLFLHSSKPQCFVHGSLNPTNILLDANFTLKLSHFGTCRVAAPDSTLQSYVDKLGTSLMNMVMQRTGDEGFSQNQSLSPIASSTYIDPESVITGETTPQFDIFSFGKIVLKLLTGKEGWGLASKVQHALDDGTLSTLLDSSAGEWPYEQAQQLAHIAVRCTDVNRENRPNLETEVLEVLRTIMDSCQGSSAASRLEGDSQSIPRHYICPINQDVMQNPNVAADGFTYEAEAIQAWINSGHNTSPMTNLRLAHTNLIPNLTLRSAIQYWLHHH